MSVSPVTFSNSDVLPGNENKGSIFGKKFNKALIRMDLIFQLFSVEVRS